ncbi:CHAT domain-containing protein [Aggregatilinea lenta]|uniref:CHAT domain-containing protein n=1 Tax=Aggregatilinea lenta TaxID=913108 RepID=UPI0013C2A6B9|nr:CHAT domain-containing protein [Aggregatilinea lenta]
MLLSFPENDVRTALEDLNSVQCLVLLGEPGIGKSSELERAYDAFVPPGPDEKVLDRIARYSPSESLKEIFEDPRFADWQHGSHNFYLFLDGLDEGTLRPIDIGYWLTRYLGKLPQSTLHRLFLRITCRTADWPDTLTTELANLWNGTLPEIYELAPLQYTDTLLATEIERVDSQAFWEEIELLGLEPLAVKPLTLKSLIREFQEQQGKLPATQIDLYERYCLRLCEEQNPVRIERKLTGQYTAASRLDAASQIAAIMVLTNQNAVWIYGSLDGMPVSIIPIDQLQSPQSNLKRDLIEEALSTGLFASRGEKRLGWAHQTFAEFLAARYLNHYLTVPQMHELVFQDGAIVPQLRALTAWLSSMNSDILAEVLQRDPQALLQGDIILADSTNRPRLVSALLHLYENGNLLDLGFDRRTQYRRWLHPDLAAQLRPYIVNREGNRHARYVAIDIAEACEVRELQDELVRTALDVETPHLVRKNAAYAIWRIGDIAAKQQLKPLIYGDIDDDDDELKGASLLALWPDHLAAEELFAVLTPPKQSNFFGAYRMFLHRDTFERLGPADLPHALRWATAKVDRALGSPLERDYALQNAIDEIVLIAWQYLDSPEVLDGFVNVALARLREFHPIAGQESYLVDDDRKPKIAEFKSELVTNHSKRHQILEAAIPSLLGYADHLHFLADHVTPLVIPEDLEWLIGRFEEVETGDLQAVFLELIQIAFYRWDANHLMIIFDAMQKNKVLEEHFRPFFVTNLDSAEARSSREHHQRMKEIEARREEARPQPPDPLPATLIAEQLEICETQDSGEWGRLSYNLIFEADGTNHFIYEPDITAMPGWQEADANTRTRILQAGIQYLKDQNPENEKWFYLGLIHWPAIAGYRALMLVHKLLPDEPILEQEVWQKWASIIMAYRSHVSSPGYEQNSELHHQLVKAAYRHAAEIMVSFLVDLIGLKDDQGHEVIYIYELLEKFTECWDDRIDQALVDKLHDPELAPDTLNVIMLRLLQRNVIGAIDFALSCIRPLPDDGPDRERAIQTTRALILYPDNVSWWSRVWPLMQKNTEFGKSVVEKVASSFDDRQAVAISFRLPEAELTNLYLWVAENYPFEEDPYVLGVHTITDRMEITTWRDKFLENLAQRGTPEAQKGIERIAEVYPSIYRVQRALQEVRESVQRLRWAPKTPGEIFAMAADASKLPERIKVLLFAAQPHDQSPLALDEEHRAITEKIRASEYRDSVELIARWAVRTDDLIQALNEHQPHIVQFSGHGNEGGLAFLDSSAGTIVIPTEAIVELLTVTADRLQVVIFNSCDSASQALKAVQHVPVAIGMSESIGDNAARIFAAQFYSSIGFGRSVRSAFEQARTAIMLEGISEVDVPRLFEAESANSSRMVLVRPSVLGSHGQHDHS